MPGGHDRQAKNQVEQIFRDIRRGIFDLDNTLYPAECNLFAQIDQRMGEFISELLDRAV